MAAESSSAAAAASAAVPKGTAAALQLVKCKVSASLLPGNLVLGSRSYAYIHRNEVCLIPSAAVALGNDKADSIKVAYTDKDAVNAVEITKLAGLGEVVIIVNQAGAIYIYDAETGQKLLHTYKHTKSSASGGGSALSAAVGGGTPSASLSLKDQHLRGIATDHKDTLYIGTQSGEILVFSLTKAKFALVKTLSAQGAEAHGEWGVSALVYSVPHATLISGDENGSLCFWSGVGDAVSAAKMVRIEGGGGSVTKVGAPVNCLALGPGALLAAAFTSGHIRLYDLARRQITHEICAHTRAINALDIHPSKPLLLAASEDTFVSCWSLPSSATPQIKQLMAESPALGLLTGCRFGGANSELIVTTIYDSRSLALMHTP